MKKINLKSLQALNTLVMTVILTCSPKGLSSQNKNCISFGVRNNETNINTYLQRIVFYSTNFYPMMDSRNALDNNIGIEINYARFMKLSKTYYLNAGASFQQERSDMVTTYTINGPRYLRNIGLHVSFEKRIKLNNEVSLGFNVGILINKGIKFPVGILGRGSYNLTTGPTATDTIQSMEETESLYLKSADLKLTPRFEVSAYFKSGKHLIKFAMFYQFEARKYNYMEYNWGFKDYYHRNYYTAEPCYTENFRMKIFGLNAGYCF